MNFIKRRLSYSLNHKFSKYDSYHSIKTDSKLRKQIIKREEKIATKWIEMLAFHYDKWNNQVKSRSLGDEQEPPEDYGGYFYSTKQVPFEQQKVDRYHSVYYRQKGSEE